MKLIDTSHPFYQPLWRRIAIVATTALWFLFELTANSASMWTIIAGALFLYTIWTLLLAWQRSGKSA